MNESAKYFSFTSGANSVGLRVFGDVSTEIEVCDAGFERCVGGHSYGPTVRNYYLIHFVVSGKGRFVTKNCKYDLDKDNAFLIRPDEIHSYRADERDPWYYLWLGFRGTGAARLVETAFGENAVTTADSGFVRNLETLYLTCADCGEMPYRLTGMVYDLAGRMIARLADNHRRPDIVKSAVGYIESNYFRPFDVTWLARELGMSRSHFTTVFTAAMHVSPYNYLTRFRVTKAESLLAAHSSITVAEVAAAVGFSSIERFSETFKKYVGLSPLAYRKSVAAK